MPGADESGELADAGIAADILREAAGEPETSERDGGSTRESRRPATSRRQAPADETLDDEDTDTEPEPTAEGDEPAADEAPAAEESDPTEAAAEESAEAEAGEPDPKKDETPEWARRRFAELTGQNRQLKQELERLRAERPPAAARTSADPIDAHILEAETPEQLSELRRQVQELEDWTEANRDGVEEDPDKGARGYSREQIAQVRAMARKQLRALETREKQLERLQQFNAAAVQLYPGFGDSDSSESRALRFVLERVPELRRLEFYRTFIGDALAGERQRLQKAQTTAAARKGPDGRPLAGKPTAEAQRPKPPSVSAAPARGNSVPSGKVVQRQKTRERAFRTGSEADIASLVEAAVG